MTAVKAKSHRRYKELVSELPEIGSLTQNSMRFCLSGGAVWMAVYESTPQQMTEEVFAGMVIKTMDAPIIKKAFSAMKPFSIRAQKKKIRKTARDNAASDSPFTFKMEFTPGRDAEEYTTIYRQCGLCALGEKEGHPELVKYMCAMDFLSVEAFGGTLYRTKLLSDGDDCCDFYVCKKDSHWDMERKLENKFTAKKS